MMLDSVGKFSIYGLLRL